MTDQQLSSSYYRSGSLSPTNSKKNGSTFNLYREDTENDFCKRCTKYIYPLGKYSKAFTISYLNFFFFRAYGPGNGPQVPQALFQVSRL